MHRALYALTATAALFVGSAGPAAASSTGWQPPPPPPAKHKCPPPKPPPPPKSCPCPTPTPTPQPPAPTPTPTPTPQPAPPAPTPTPVVVVIQQPPPPPAPTVNPLVCESRRTIHFLVRRTYLGQRIVAVRASERGFKVTVKRVIRRGHLRFRVTATPVTLNARRAVKGTLRTVTVRVRLANGRHVRMVWFWRQCIGNDGDPNDPSAAGNHGPGA